MYSDQFTVPVQGKLTKWRLKMYPNGRKAVDQGYVTLFLKDSGVIGDETLEESSGFSKFASSALPYAVGGLIILRCLSVRKFWSNSSSEENSASTANATNDNEYQRL